MRPEGRTVLIVDDEPVKRTVMGEELAAAGYDVATAANPLEADRILADKSFDVIITDLRMPGQDGISFLRTLKSQQPDQVVIVMTAYGTVDSAVEAMKLGAFDYLQKPFTSEELMLKLDRLRHYQQLTEENKALRQQISSAGTDTRFIGQSEAIRKVLSKIHAVSDSDSTVLIEGESGTGKELVARLIHESSLRNKGPFISVACASLPETLIESELFGHEPGAFTDARTRRMGRFELAHTGTLFLDDIDDTPSLVQVKLLRVLQERRFERLGSEHSVSVNVRLIAATKHNLRRLVSDNNFREDLYYRLNVVPICLPPLRDRMEDIPLLVSYFLESISMRLGRDSLTMDQAAMDKLMRHSWPGNVRELEHIIEQVVTLTDKARITAHDIPLSFEQGSPSPPVQVNLQNLSEVDLQKVLDDVQAKIIHWAMDKCGGNLAKAAKQLGIPRSSLQYKLGKSGFPKLGDTKAADDFLT
ncbi:MAG: response regulator [Actinobacteria bacterium]|nr:response regulator [Actinomycetota bacterium]